ncbi:MAG: NHL repeat-containing protein [Blastocatellia bacterium]|nr:NHL repeat-containing protein [Blastocatellia bacterium]
MPRYQTLHKVRLINRNWMVLLVCLCGLSFLTMAFSATSANSIPGIVKPKFEPQTPKAVDSTLAAALTVNPNLCFILVNSTAQEVTITQPNGVRNSNCTLGEAILAANGNPTISECPCQGNGGPVQIFLQPYYSTFTLTEPATTLYGPTGLPAVSSNVTILGNGCTIERSSAGGTPNFRLFSVAGTINGVQAVETNPNSTNPAPNTLLPAGNLTLQNLTLRNGVAQGGNGGGKAGGGGGMGGAVFNAGTLTLENVTVTNNRASGGNTPLSGSSGGGGGMGGSGGTGFNLGGGGGGMGGNGGFTANFDPAGAGGGTVGNAVGPTAGTLNGGASGNFGTGGTGGFGGGGGGNRGAGGFGGGAGGTFSGAGASGGFGGGGGAGQPGGNGGFGGGGATYNSTGPGSSSGVGGFGGGNGGGTITIGGGGAGFGGGIFTAGTLTVTNSTFAGNLTTGGIAGTGNNGNNGSAFGGAIFARNGSTTLTNVTLAGNTATQGGGLYVLGDGATATLTVKNTIVSNSSSNDAFVNTINSGTVSQNNTTNLVVNNGAGANALTGVTQTGDPNLSPLNNNDGQSQTMALNSPSPAIGTGTPSGAPAKDQRAYCRLSTISLGAFEFNGTAPNATASIVRADVNPVCGPATVSWTLNFSADTAGLTASDFNLAGSGLAGAGITNVSGSGRTWTVTANTGTGTGLLRLDMISGPCFQNLPFTSGESYTVNAAPAVPPIQANPSAVCAGSSGNMASGPAAAGYAWTITNGTITSAANLQTIAYTAGPVGMVQLSLTVFNAAGCSASNSLNVAINPQPAIPSITTPTTVCANSTGNQASGPAGPFSYAWTIANGTITGPANGQNITYTAGPSGAVQLGLTVTGVGNCAASNSTNVTINDVPVATLTAPTGPLCIGSTGNLASIPDAGVGATYNWTITNGTITSGTGTRQITFTVGSTSPLMLAVTVTNSGGCSASGGPVNIPVQFCGVEYTRLFAADTYNNRVQKFEAGGWTVLATPVLNLPEAVTASFDGLRIYVADTGNHKVIRSTDGGASWTDFAVAGLVAPQGLALDASGHLYVSNTGGNQVLRYDESTPLGTPLVLAGPGSGAGQVTDPRGLAIDTTNRLFIADRGNNRIFRIPSANTTPGAAFQVAGKGAGAAPFGQVTAPEGVAVDNLGNLYVADTGNNRVIRFAGGNNGAAAVLCSLSTSLTAPALGQVRGAEGVTIVNAGLIGGTLGQPAIVVADTQNQRIQGAVNPATTPGPWQLVGTPNGKGTGPGQFSSPGKIR